jgi:uncharacterized membrane protein YgcG
MNSSSVRFWFRRPVRRALGSLSAAPRRMTPMLPPRRRRSWSIRRRSLPRRRMKLRGEVRHLMTLLCEALVHGEHLPWGERHDLLEPHDHDVGAAGVHVEPLGDVQVRRRALPVRVPAPGPHVQSVRLGVVSDGMFEKGVADRAVADAVGPLARERVDAVLGPRDAPDGRGETRVRRRGRGRGEPRRRRRRRRLVEGLPGGGRGAGSRRRPPAARLLSGGGGRGGGGGGRATRPAVVEEVREHVGEALHADPPIQGAPPRVPRSLSGSRTSSVLRVDILFEIFLKGVCPPLGAHHNAGATRETPQGERRRFPP